MTALARIRAALTRRAARRRTDRALLRLARQEPPMNPAPLAATEDEMRSPHWCWMHGCHRSQCPQPQPGEPH
ncbi:hypothetical protein [Streptomyces sp. SID2888]|uniref:hypothetical protein n=1 Tax=Streptomyces sp. SID2888 TaxID=2690256 RepID=UPI0013710E07|nr:hypothetical protein [Streptomyces sp. SID2888]MYV44953.1 hypothetical protein [Streptomyces sp. SID2888]